MSAFDSVYLISTYIQKFIKLWWWWYIACQYSKNWIIHKLVD